MADPSEETQLPSVVLELPSEPHSVAKARAALDPFKAALAPELHEDLRLVISELVTNAVVHGPGGPVLIRVELDDVGRVRGEVEDGGHGPIDRGGENAARPGGQGLTMVEAVSRRWGIDGGAMRRFWFELGG